MERPLLGELLKTQLEEDKVNIETQKKTFLENHKKAHVADVAAKVHALLSTLHSKHFTKHCTKHSKHFTKHYTKH